FRGILSRSERSFEGPGPLAVGGGGGLAETSTEYSLASSFVSAFRRGLTLEVRAGVSGSDRSFESATEGLPSAWLVEAGLPVGAVPAAPAESSRLDAIFLPMARLEIDRANALRFGLSLRASRFTMASALWGTGDFLFTDAAALLAGRGYGRVAERVEESFTTRELGVFAQWDGTPAPGVELSLGGRFDWEMIPSAEPRLSQEWLAVTGLRNDDYP